ncbi:hypothetical protein GCM10012275_22030 [Longimycelium tulufanense]|uniref:Uncharacterized protein n=1 Tax=Longimycelium tulufanense TaxID=907463 RepID=A0A8J3FW63_9PSEU|nr:ATP-binding protein [Longimycelium tulufanense]GGM50764.1 hypothetical protein GCM10012275_22030 [Longimycelium tulufanense]
MNAHTVQVDDLRLATLPTAVNCADLFVQFTLAEWSLRPLLDEAMTAARQLVSDAVDRADPAVPDFLTVRLRLRGDCLTVEVEQAGGARSGAPAAAVEGRRGGARPLAGGGTLVWCELPLPGGVNASSVPLPRREPKRSASNEPVTDDADVTPEVIQRILDALGRHAK